MKKLVAGACLAAVAVVGWKWQQGDEQPADRSGARLAFNRFWVDHMPTDERDAFNVFVLNSPEPLGAFAQETVWRGQIERFRYERAGDRVHAIFPWSGDSEEITLKAWKCDEADMDYCLEVSGSKRGVSRYYSRIGWERRNVADMDAFRAQLLPAHK